MSVFNEIIIKNIKLFDDTSQYILLAMSIIKVKFYIDNETTTTNSRNEGNFHGKPIFILYLIFVSL